MFSVCIADLNILIDNKCSYIEDMCVDYISAFYHNVKYVECTDKEYLKYVRKVLFHTSFKVMSALGRIALRKIFK